MRRVQHLLPRRVERNNNNYGPTNVTTRSLRGRRQFRIVRQTIPGRLRRKNDRGLNHQTMTKNIINVRRIIIGNFERTRSPSETVRLNGVDKRLVRHIREVVTTSMRGNASVIFFRVTTGNLVRHQIFINNKRLVPTEIRDDQKNLAGRKLLHFVRLRHRWVVLRGALGTVRETVGHIRLQPNLHTTMGSRRQDVSNNNQATKLHRGGVRKASSSVPRVVGAGPATTAAPNHDEPPPPLGHSQ